MGIFNKLIIQKNCISISQFFLDTFMSCQIINRVVYNGFTRRTLLSHEICNLDIKKFFPPKKSLFISLAKKSPPIFFTNQQQ